MTKDAGQIVFFKLVTTGPNPSLHRILEFGAIAYDVADAETVERMTVQVECQPDDLAAARIGEELLFGYEQGDPKPALDAAREISAFLTRHSTVFRMSGTNGKRFRVARLAGHGVAKRDFPHLRRWFDGLGEFLPADPFVMDTIQLRAWGDLDAASTDPYEILTADSEFAGEKAAPYALRSVEGVIAWLYNEAPVLVDFE